MWDIDFNEAFLSLEFEFGLLITDLGQNKIDKEGMSQLHLGEWPRLKILTLTHNPIGN